MERPENIKKGLECFAQDRSYMLPCSECAYHGQGLPHCRKAVHEDALALIENLIAERDAAIADIPRICACCKHYVHKKTHLCRSKTPCANISGTNTAWEWRGAKMDGGAER